MARIRSIHPDACDSEKLARLSHGAERALWRLITHSDDEGRGVDNPKLLAAKLFPLVDEVDGTAMDGFLDELAAAGMLVRYEAGGKRYYEVHDFTDWQRPKRPTPSKLPAPEEGVPHTSPTPHPHVPPGVGEGDGGGVEEETPPSTGVDPEDTDELEEQFEQLWAVWPKRNGKKIGKGDALRVWRRLTLPQRRDAYRGARNYAAACADPRITGVGAQDCHRWLTKRRWVDWQEPAVPDGQPPPATTQVSTFSEGGRF